MTRFTAHVRRQAIAYAALFVALGGTAWAAATVGPGDIQDDAVRARHIAAGSVHSGQIHNEGVFSADLRDGQVAGRDIRNATVRGVDVADGSLSGADIADAPTGNDDVNADEVDGHDATCPATTAVIDGRCYERAPRAPAPSVFSASDQCGAAGGRLPGTLELRLLRDEPGFDLGDDAASAEFTSAVFFNGALATLVVQDSGGITESDPVGFRPYRCVFDLLR